MVDDDLYVGANEFVLDGTINGDVISAGQKLTINGTVNGNLIVGGQTVEVNGTVTGDVVAAGSIVLIGEKASIGGDVVAAGYSIEFRKGALIGRDAILAAGQVLMAADVRRNMKAGTPALEIAGKIGGDVKAAVGEYSAVQAGPPPTVFMPQSSIVVPVIQQGLTIDQGARILGDLEYTQNTELSFPAGAVAGRAHAWRSPKAAAEPTVSRPLVSAQERGRWIHCAH